MSYIGQVPIDEFVAVPTKDSFTGDASTTTFDLANSVASGSVNTLDVFIDNVRQEPGSGKAFTLGVDGSGDMKRITFTAAPASSAAIYVLNPLTNTQAIAPVITDLNGVELILDADGDTSITADTDDRIDIKVSNTDQIQIADGVIKPVTDSDVDLGTSSLYFKDAFIDTVTTTGNVTVGGDLTITGTTSFADTNITNVGSIALDTITNDGTDVTIDSSGDIILDADGTQIFLKDAGTTFGSLTQTGGELVIKSSSSDTTALTFAGANATLAGTLGVGAVTSTGIVTGTAFTAGSAVLAEAELELLDGLTAGTAIASKVVTTDASIDTTGQRNLTISGELDAATLDISGNADIDGTLEADAITINGTAIGAIYQVLAGSSDIVTTGALGSGSIATGFGNIDNGASNITSGGLVKLDVDADADDETGDSATGRLTMGAGEDLNLYHSGSHSYIVNDTGHLYITTGGSDQNIYLRGNDGGGMISALTLDMSEVGAATFSGALTVTGVSTLTGSATFSGGALLSEGTLTDQATVTWDIAAEPVAKVTLGANRTLAAPSNPMGNGQFISLLIIQDGTGSRTLTWNAVYEFKDDTAPTLTTTASKGDVFVFRYNGAKYLEVGRNTALTLS